MKAVLLLALFGVSAIQAAIFGCTMRPASNVTVTGGYGAVVCNSGMDDTGGSEVNTMACSFWYANLTSAVTLSHFHVGTDATQGGPVTFTFDPTGLAANRGTAFQRFVATATTGAPSWQQQNGLTFDAQVTSCATGNNCYFNLHTSTYGGGELRCELQPLSATNGYDYTVTLTPVAGGNGNANSTGHATVTMVTVMPASTPAVHAWAYNVDFSLSSNINNAHIHQGTTTSDNGPVKVQFAQGPPRMMGKFVGVALEGVTAAEQPTSNWPSYASDFDTAMSSHFNYINVHSVTNAGGEIRSQISPTSGGGGGSSAASQLTIAFASVFVMVAAWMAL